MNGAHPARQFVKRTLQGLLPRSKFLVRGPVGSGEVSLTFDDGPHAEHTPRLLDVLAEQDVQATFFVVGQRAAEHPGLIQRMAAEGHLLGHHSYTHSEPRRTSAGQLLAEVQQCEQLLQDVTGKRSSVFRPPLGKLTGAKLWQLWRAGQSVVLWNVDPRDYACRDAQQCAEFFVEHPLTAGDLVLLHDVHPHAAHVLPDLIDSVRERGLQFVTVDHWLRA
jgi:peptidoglycan/xylan/chitin deacetylase (PgdA/CDA1 family)